MPRPQLPSRDEVERRGLGRRGGGVKSYLQQLQDVAALWIEEGGAGAAAESCRQLLAVVARVLQC